MATYKEVLAMCKKLYAKQYPEARRGPGIKTCHIALGMLPPENSR